MLPKLVNSVRQKPRAQSPSTGVVMQLTLPIGVRQMCLLFPTLLNIFLEDIVTQSLDNYNGTTSIGGGGGGWGGGRTITNLCFARAKLRYCSYKL